jgi:transcriptional regulator with XRE-family HTH domain
MAQARLCPACRKTRLSRYNPDPLCGPCTRGARTTSALAERGAPTWLWDSPPMRDALARVDLAAAVAVFRAGAGLSQHELADITGWSQSSLSLFESGHRDTLYDVRALLRFADTVNMPREALLPLILGHPDAALPDAWQAELSVAADSVLEEAGVDVDRRGFGSLVAGALAAVALPEVTSPSRVTASHVQYLKACLERTRNRDQNVGGGAVLRQALAQFSRARMMLDKCDYSEQIGRALLAMTAELAVAAGWVAYDSAQQRLARQLYNQAELLAGTADDTELTVHVYANMALQCTHLARVSSQRGVAREAMRFADRAADTARSEASPRLRALTNLRQATAHAQLDDERAFRMAIASARREFDRGPYPADPSWARFVTVAEITGHEAMGWVSLGSPGRAASLYRAVLDDQRLLRRNRAYYHARLVGALIAEGDDRQALAEGVALLPFLDDGHITSRRTFNELRSLRAIGDDLGADEFCMGFDAAEQKLAA